MPFLGAHESVAGGLHLAFNRLQQVGGEALQIFTRNQRQWHPQPLTEDEIALFQVAWQQAGRLPVGRSCTVHGAHDTKASLPVVASHASYLINLASGKQELMEKSITAFAAEIHRCEQLGLPFVVIHPGSHGGDGVEAGLARFSMALDLALEETGGEVTVLLETTAGQGTSLGSRFEELASVLERSRYPQRQPDHGGKDTWRWPSMTVWRRTTSHASSRHRLWLKATHTPSTAPSVTTREKAHTSCSGR